MLVAAFWISLPETGWKSYGIILDIPISLGIALPINNANARGQCKAKVADCPLAKRKFLCVRNFDFIALGVQASAYVCWVLRRYLLIAVA